MVEIFELLFTWLIEFEYKNEGNTQKITITTKGIDMVITCETSIQVYIEGSILQYKDCKYKGERYWKEISKDRICKMEDYLSTKANQIYNNQF